MQGRDGNWKTSSNQRRGGSTSWEATKSQPRPQLRSRKDRDSTFRTQAWLPTPMLGGEPLMDDASIRDFNEGIRCHVASALEQTLLLPRDMVEL